MARNVSASTREALQASQTDKIFLPLLRIYSDELAEDLYFVQNTENIISNGNTYIAASFSMSLPVQEEGKVQDTTLTISGVNRQITELIRSITSPLDIEMTIIRSDTPDTLEAGPWDFKLRSVTYNVNSISGSLLYETSLRKYISTIRVTNQSFPGAM